MAFERDFNDGRTAEEKFGFKPNFFDIISSLSVTGGFFWGLPTYLEDTDRDIDAINAQSDPWHEEYMEGEHIIDDIGLWMFILPLIYLTPRAIGLFIEGKHPLQTGKWGL